MGSKTAIQWCDHTWNPWRGCAKVATGCVNCYAERMARRNPRVFGTWGSGARVIAAESYWRLPYRWDRAAERAGVRRRVFCGSLMDVFEDRPELVSPRLRLVRTIADTPSLDWLVLTKRPENLERHWPRDSVHDSKIEPRHERWMLMPQPSVWLVYSASTQADLERGLPHLLRVPAAVRGLSLEPLVKEIYFCTCRSDITPVGWHTPECALFRGGGPMDLRRAIDWVIVGGESGPDARPCDVRWVQSIVRQCQASGVPVFVKQLGALCLVEAASGVGPEIVDRQHAIYGEWPEGTMFGNRTGLPELNGRQVLLRDPKGGDPAEWPEDLRVREFPKARAR